MAVCGGDEAIVVAEAVAAAAAAPVAANTFDEDNGEVGSHSNSKGHQRVAFGVVCADEGVGGVLPQQEVGGVCPGQASGESSGQEMATFKSSVVVARPAPPQEPCVICVATDLTNTNWRESRYTYSLPLSSSVTDLCAAFAKEARYTDNTFDLVWRKQAGDGPVEEEVILDWHSTATLHEMDMLSEPIKSQFWIKEKADGSPPLREQAQTEAGASSTSSEQPSSQAVSGSSGAAASSYSSTGWNYSSNYSYNYTYGFSTKSDTGYVGLVNQAMTCYLNSLLQSLYMTPEFRSALYLWEFSGESEMESKSIPYQLQRLFLQLQTSNKRAVETTDVTKSFGWDSSEAWQQHDVQELCRVMFDALEKRFKKDRHHDADLINKLYQGDMKDYVKCLKCGYESARKDQFLDIPLVIKPFGSTQAYSSVEEALDGFVQPETLDGDNQYFCERCDMKCDAHKGLKFTRFPYLLTLQLKRFDFDYTTMHRIKLNDRMEFPKILDLNRFVDPSDIPPADEDVEDMYSGFEVEHFDPPPRPPPPPYSSSSARGTYGSASYDMTYQGGSYTINNFTETSTNPTIKISNDNDLESPQAEPDNDERPQDAKTEREGVEGGPCAEVEGVAGEGVEGDGVEGAVQGKAGFSVGRLMKRGPYVYELFSIMIHSGSAVGGHYYAYIKSFSDKRWYCFNDQSVYKITQEDIEQAFGGVDSRSRGYYSSVYSSSANAYMLMYRRIDSKENKAFLPKDDFPSHIKQQIADEAEQERREQQRHEMDKNMCKFRLFCRPPPSLELLDRRLEVHKDLSLSEVTAQAYNLLGLKGRGIPLERCRLVKYDEYSETLDQSFEDGENEAFGVMVGGPRSYYSFELCLEIRGEKQTFKPYKRGGLNVKVLVVDVVGCSVAEPVWVRAEQAWTVQDLKDEIAEKLELSVDTMNIAMETYQNEGKPLSVPARLLKSEGFYRKHTVFVCCDPEDHQKSFRESEMSKIIDSHANSISLTVLLPPTPPKRRSGPAHTDPGASRPCESSVAAQGRPTLPESPPNVADADDASGPVGGVVNQPDGEGGVSSGLSNRAEPAGAGEGGVEVGVASQLGSEVGGASAAETESSKDVGVAPVVTTPLVGVGAREVRLRVDRRITLTELKGQLEQHVGTTSEYFKVFRVYSNNQEYEMFRLGDTLSTVPNDTRMVVKLGRALKPGEFRVKLFLLRIRKPEFSTHLLDSIVAKGKTVRWFKEQIVQEVSEQGGAFPLDVERLRLRKKTWRSAGTIYIDSQVFEKDIQVFASFEMYVEPLEGPEPMLYVTQMQVYLRRWRRSQFHVEPTSEIILDTNSPEDLRRRISESSDIPLERVEFAKGFGSFPHEMSVLDIEEDLDWSPAVSTISAMPLSIYDDGCVIYYKDSSEPLAELSPERKSELQKLESARLSKYSTGGTTFTYSSYRTKEKALKIYMDDEDEGAGPPASQGEGAGPASQV